ncbi:MAG: 16S rRNA (cytosine(1402)-N(4))-methyltransferase RsmH [Bacteroidales bacterium]|nr:16S rRNA (cytosine(1402)-N(4))-methyltransferase RsmH [Bacteroidales bacterium]
MSEYHTPVMLQESISSLVTNPNGIYADVTFGGGGHTAGLLSRINDGGSVIAFDRDLDAINGAFEDPRLTLLHNNFRYIENYAALYKVQFDGILADLGVSSHQFDTPERGFSFRYDAPLDMRMNEKGAITAADILNTREPEEIERILKVYGEVDGARRMASLIADARKAAPIRTSGDLDKAIEKMLPKGAEHKVLAKVYQALRIEVNGELRSLEKFLEGAARSLKEGGRLVVITYHSLEDRMVKNFIKCGNVEGIEEKDMYGRTIAPLEAVNRKPITPAESEIAANTRARSAKLRVAQRRAAV